MAYFVFPSVLAFHTSYQCNAVYYCTVHEKHIFFLKFNTVLKENGKLLKLLVILWISQSSCPVAVTSGQFGLSWKVSLGRTASGLQPEQAGARAVAELRCFSRYSVLAAAWWSLSQSSVSETGSSLEEAQQWGEKKKVNRLENVYWLQIVLSSNWLTRLFNTFPKGVVIPLRGTQASVHKTNKTVLSASWGAGRETCQVIIKIQNSALTQQWGKQTCAVALLGACWQAMPNEF